MPHGRLIVTLTFAATMLATVGAAVASCISQQDREAYEVYALRTEALVGAQSCRMTAQFNLFAIKFGNELAMEGKTLRSHYQKAYGKRGDSVLDDFVTRLSNATVVAGSGSAGYCSTTASLLNVLVDVPVGQLASFAKQRPAPALPTMAVCSN